MMSTIRDNHHERYAAQVPPIFHILTTWWRMPAALTYTLFKALRGSKAQAPKSLYHDLYVFERMPGLNAHGLIFSTCAAYRVVQVLEALVEEKRLTRRQGNDIQECILAALRADGTWR